MEALHAWILSSYWVCEIAFPCIAVCSITLPTRGKGLRQDYRFLPEPDLPTVCLTEGLVREEEREGVLSVQEAATHLPPLPMEARRRLAETYGERAALACVEWQAVTGWVRLWCCHGNDIDCLMNWVIILTYSNSCSK